MAGDILGVKNPHRFKKAVQRKESIMFEPWGISVKVNFQSATRLEAFGQLSKARKLQVLGTLQNPLDL
jgi:hypothetical protein